MKNIFEKNIKPEDRAKAVIQNNTALNRVSENPYKKQEIDSRISVQQNKTDLVKSNRTKNDDHNLISNGKVVEVLSRPSLKPPIGIRVGESDKISRKSSDNQVLLK